MTAQGEAGGPQEGTTVPAAAPDDERQLAEEIEQTREQLGETVQALTAKADVKVRAQDKVAELTGRLKDTAGQAAQQAEAAVAGISKVTPEPARQATAKTAGVARQRRVPLAAAAAVAVLAWLIIRWRRR
jgi:Protein of unknown function (DUF3618)